MASGQGNPLESGAGDQPHVVFDGVSKSYGETLAVRRLDLAIERGEFLTLLGPSGSGKTTALMMLAGFEQPSSGQILLDGQRIDPVPANRRNFGLVFQSYALFPHMSVAENLAYPLKVRRLGRSEVTDRVARILDLVQLPGFGGRRPDQLSGGQQQRVAVARALIFEPSLVLMDEPLGALDKQLREQMQIELKAIHARLGVTFLYVTHDQSEALTLSDRIAIFAKGEVQQVATPRALYERPETSFIAGFVGENNLLAGSILGLSDGVARIGLVGGAEVLAAAAPGLRQGAQVLVSLRPERIRLLAEGDQAEVTLPARLIEVIYGGDHLRLIAQPRQGDSPLVIKIAAGSLNEARAASLVPGERLLLGWDITSARALPGGEGSA